MDIRGIMLKAALLKASDVHLTVGSPPCVRVDGTIRRLELPELSGRDIEEMLNDILSEEQLRRFNENGETDLALSMEGAGRLRVNAYRQRGEAAAALRILNSKIPDPASLGLPKSVTDVVDKKRGLVLVTGVTGSGKSTTLASLIDLINQKYSYHIITLEDPVEYLHTHKKSIVDQREMGDDSKSYATALRAALRQDPDVILVGEMRDLEAISIAVTAAETGHLVFSTLHTLGATNSVDRIIDVFPPYQQQQIRAQLAEVLECVVSQQLIPRAGGTGRVAAIEVMTMTPAVRTHIREGKTFLIASAMQTGRRSGMQTMDDALFDLCRQKLITRESAMQYAVNLDALLQRGL